MKRMKFLFGQRRMQVLLTLAVLLLAVSVVIGSGASFTSTSANPGNVFTAGNLTHTNTGAVMTVSKLKPDDAWVSAGSVAITNTGDIDGAFSMTGAITADTSGTGHSGKLSDVLEIRVHAASDLAGVYKYNGPIDGITDEAMGTILGGGSASQTYTFEVRFPNGTTSLLANGGDNAYKGASLTIDFNWTAVNL